MRKFRKKEDRQMSRTMIRRAIEFFKLKGWTPDLIVEFFEYITRK